MNREAVSEILKCTPVLDMNQEETDLCSKHYRMLHKELDPISYQKNCAVCSSTITGSSSFRCSEPEIFLSHLQTGFSGTISSGEKICMACYRYYLEVVKQLKGKSPTSDSDLLSLVTAIKNSTPTLPFEINEENESIEVALELTVISVAHELQENRAITLPSAHSHYKKNIELILP